ncbi:MAG: right-handed parallel beta-helix repeat-containing protein [Candidatus Marinimicrobia bacterium]|nr:right-handed parallel beta-helix repeat-containing protein [Candidatus Neomarinimicrobiota bacterium]
MIENNSYTGIWFNNSTITIENNLISSNALYGVVAINTSSPNIYQSTMSYNGRYGAVAAWSSTPRFALPDWSYPGNNLIKNNVTYGIFVRDATPFLGSTDSYGGQIGGGNSIFGHDGANDYNIRVDVNFQSTIIDAEHTWWGTTSE